MLVLTRQVEEEIVVGSEVRIKVVAVSGNQVRLGIEAPPQVQIFRREVFDAICRENAAAAREAQASVSGLSQVLKRS
jgi:carbon storage regulator